MENSQQYVRVVELKGVTAACTFRQGVSEGASIKVSISEDPADSTALVCKAQDADACKVAGEYQVCAQSSSCTLAET